MPLHPLAKNLRDERIALAPEFDSPAVARCCDAWNRAFQAAKAAGTNPVSVYLRANEAYHAALPPLSSQQNLCYFIACVAHGIATRAICDPHARGLLEAAKVASRAFRYAANQPKQKTEN